MNQKNIIIAVIVIVVIIVGIMLTKEPRVSDQLGDIETQLAECQSRLATWQTDYGSENPRSEEGQDALDEILTDCEDVIDQAEQSI